MPNSRIHLRGWPGVKESRVPSLPQMTIFFQKNLSRWKEVRVTLSPFWGHSEPILHFYWYRVFSPSFFKGFPSCNISRPCLTNDILEHSQPYTSIEDLVILLSQKMYRSCLIIHWFCIHCFDSPLKKGGKVPKSHSLPSSWQIALVASLFRLKIALKIHFWILCSSIVTPELIFKAIFPLIWYPLG